MYKRTEKVRKQREEQKYEIAVYLGTQPEHPRGRFRRKTYVNLKSGRRWSRLLGTRPRYPRDRFRDRVKDKIGTNHKTGKKFI